MASRSKLIEQAALESLVKYAPQRTGLNAIKGAAQEQYAASTQAGDSAAKLGVQAVKEALPEVNEGYKSALSDQQATQGRLAQVLAGLGPVANGYKAASDTEAAGARELLKDEQAHNVAGLRTQGVAAAAGAQFAQTSARATLAKELGKLFTSEKELEGQEGADQQATVNKDTENAAKLTQQENASKRSAGIDPATGKPIVGGKLDKQTKNLLAPAAQDKAGGTIEQVKQLAKELRTHNASRAEIISTLTSGEPSVTLTHNKKGKAFPNPVKVPAIPAFKPDVLMSAGLDLAEYGHLQKGTQERLQKAGYSIDHLQLPSYGGYLKQLRSTGSRAAASAGSTGRKVSSALGA